MIKKIKEFRIKSLIDVGCGSGDLSFEASKILRKSVGIDFSENMIKLAKKKFKKKNLQYENISIFIY